jgi:serine/threonine-protein kinase HSL1, negative regulator of Swe1 kinase
VLISSVITAVIMADTMVHNTARSPLSEASNRINSAYHAQEVPNYKARNYQSVAQNAHVQVQDATRAFFRGPPQQHVTTRTPSNPHPAPSSTRPQPTLRPPQEADEHKRLSQASHDSSASNRSKKNYKTHIGPWQLGKTLGKGSSARVRLCRHNITNQLAAVKIVNRRMAYLVQDSSLAALSKWDNALPEQNNGEMRIPMAIEREVAILKLIEHPNIMKLYDVWENRSEM